MPAQTRSVRLAAQESRDVEQILLVFGRAQPVGRVERAETRLLSAGAGGAAGCARLGVAGAAAGDAGDPLEQARARGFSASAARRPPFSIAAAAKASGATAGRRDRPAGRRRLDRRAAR